MDDLGLISAANFILNLPLMYLAGPLARIWLAKILRSRSARAKYKPEASWYVKDSTALPSSDLPVRTGPKDTSLIMGGEGGKDGN